MTRGALRAVVCAAVLLAGGAAWSQDTAPAPLPEPSAQQRQTMAEIHRKMAECLASTRPFSECRNEMHASCQQRLGQTGCPMMGGMGLGMGMGRGMRGRMGPGPGTAPGQPGTPAPNP